ncbi:UDP-N-acetylmuramoyl-L-alanyl-D-glutamate--2,6-diaminopimelate ligase [Bacillus sp. FJAT-45350]|uniref:UDP-N-acetylmuramoyl-L-alanyl-D-glutamate--2, 6-diaminopimelate ligase n=1 Tax=Bacillus sp. FJAT-45350 TaxID=2011014 RepID=UPI000BB97E8E|nr:UDP-N-acetylmuramoyl-L-alanyl-D-glutamate--2,6-diaminopimelate ligase [Bacillus sp. FJAT-45350]
MKLDKLTNILQNHKKIGDGNPEISSVEMDSREVTNGSLFICIDGYTVDGHDFIDKAIENGAVAVLAEKEVETTVPVIRVHDTKRAMAIVANYFYNHPTRSLNLIGITGTNGKTTITHLIEKILRDVGENTGLIGTMYMKIGDEVREVKNTTPESLSLQKAFHEMREKKVDTAVMEVSSHALHLGRVRGCDFNIAVFTNLTPDHLDYHKTMEAYMYAKGLLFAQLGNTYDEGKLKVGILNNDDPASQEYDKMTTAQILTYGIDTKSDVMAKDIKMSAGGTSFVLTTANESIEMKLKLIGKFSVYNALAATGACLAYGISLEQIKESLEQVEGVAGRFEPVDAGQSYTVVVDYAHTSDSLENVLKTVQEFAQGKVYVVVGCGGDRDKTKRPIMAKIASEHSDFAVFTSDNPRSEDPAQILKDMEEGVKGCQNYRSVIDRKEAIYDVINMAKDNDVIVIAGKGHETYQIVGKETFEFDDRLVARKAIEERE